MYVKPLVLENGDIAEGVFAASGGDCWTVKAKTTQDWNGAYHVYEINATHNNTIHTTTQVTFVFTFSMPITEARPEAEDSYDFKVEGQTVTVIRKLHANGYGSEDNVSFKLFVRAADEATTKALDEMPAISYSCRHETNVQGGID